MTARVSPQTLEPEELIYILRESGLIGPGQIARIEPLTGGVSSWVARVETVSRVFCVKRALPKLRVAQDWSAPLERNEAEVAWIGVCAQIVPDAVPRIFAHMSQFHMFAMEYFDPALFTNWKANLLAGIADSRLASRVASKLVAIHRATAGDPVVARAFTNGHSFESLRLDPYLGEAARAHTDVASFLDQLAERTRANRLALIHGDLSPKNILFNGTRTVLLDAECADFGDPAFDIAFCLSHFLLKMVHRPDAVRSYMSCFQAFTRTYLGGVTWESAIELDMRASTLLPALLLARVDGKSPVEYLNECARDAIRRFSRHALIHPPLSLAAFFSFTTNGACCEIHN
jgi:aminoglycoside phosphotransferase (APT) family kinase protein